MGVFSSSPMTKLSLRQQTSPGDPARRDYVQATRATHNAYTFAMLIAMIYLIVLYEFNSL